MGKIYFRGAATVEEIKGMTPEQYENYLRENLMELLANSKRAISSKAYKSNELYKFLMYAPVDDNGNPVEDKEKAKARLKFKNELKDKYYKELAEENKGEVFDFSNYIEIAELETLIGITRKNISALIASNQDLKAITVGGRTYVSKESVLQFLDNRYLVGVDQINYAELIKLDRLKRQAKNDKKLEYENDYNEELKRLTKKYEKEVPSHLKVFNDIKNEDMTELPLDTENGDIEKFVLGDIDMTQLYNPILRKVGKKHTTIPTLVSASKFACDYGKDERTLYRYCELGYVYFYKIGNKHLVSVDDTKANTKRIELMKKKYGKKPTSGRRNPGTVILGEEYRELLTNKEFIESISDYLKSGYSYYKKIDANNRKIKLYEDENEFDLAEIVRSENSVLLNKLNGIRATINDKAKDYGKKEISSAG